MIDAMAVCRDRLMLAVVGSAAAVLILSVALAFAATSPKRVVLVPGAKAPCEAMPDEVPDEAARSFALLYVLTFDNYTPATIEAAATALKARVAPPRFTEVADALDRRSRVVVEGRMSSHAVSAEAPAVTRPGDGTLVVHVKALRRLFIADKLSKESIVGYRLVLELCPPTAANPNGLAVLAQDVEEHDEARR